MDCYQAAEDQQDLHSQGIRAGRRMAPAPVTVPAGTVHAVPEDTQETLCGLPVRTLHSFPDLAYRSGLMATVCRVCDRLYAEQGPQSD